MIKHLCSKHEALNSIPNTAKTTTKTQNTKTKTTQHNKTKQKIPGAW
jgi:hypothetical protein